MKPLSIRAKLTFWLLLPLSIFSLIIFTYFYVSLQERIDELFNKVLLGHAKNIERLIGIKNNELYIDLSDFYISLSSEDDKGVVYYSVVNTNLDTLVGYSDLLKKSAISGKNILYYDTYYNQTHLKALTYTTSITNAGKKYIAYITLAESTEKRDEELHSAFEVLLFVSLGIYIFIIFIIILALYQGLKPLKYLKKVIQKRDSFDLEPLDFVAPKELETVVESINILIKRNKDSLEYLERFNADVSHQLKTPIAELRVKLDLLCKKDDKHYIELNQTLDKMTHLIRQMLLYAKTNKHAAISHRKNRINLNTFCTKYSKKIIPKIYDNGFEFAYECLDENIYIFGDTILLESMLDNLINNSLCYARDEKNQALGTITLSIKKIHNKIYLHVKDEGYGIDDEDISKIFQRHFRADMSKSGHGLGLGIVKQIARLHEANVKVKNENGFSVYIIFNER